MIDNDPIPELSSHAQSITNWRAIVAEHQEPNRWRASWQIANSLGGYAALWILMYFSLSISWLLTIPLAVLAGGMLVRIFIIFHDCGHGSFFKSRWSNDVWGFVTGLLTFTPYHHWRWEHSIHHTSAGNLDRRGVGDIWTMTVKEYLRASRWKKFSYRLARNPFVLFLIAPLVIFLFRQRFSLPDAKPRVKASVRLVNLSILALAVGLVAVFGLLPWLIIQLIILAVAGAAGLWLFYIQHQFEDTYWERGKDWDYVTVAMQGSSFYKLPKILQWFSGNIGYHHIHHLSARIPNYNLEKCHRSHPDFSHVPELNLWGSLKSLRFRLWDEESRKLIGFGQLKKLMRTRAFSSG